MAERYSEAPRQQFQRRAARTKESKSPATIPDFREARHRLAVADAESGGLSGLDANAFEMEMNPRRRNAGFTKSYLPGETPPLTIRQSLLAPLPITAQGLRCIAGHRKNEWLAPCGARPRRQACRSSNYGSDEARVVRLAKRFHRRSRKSPRAAFPRLAPSFSRRPRPGPGCGRIHFVPAGMSRPPALASAPR